MRKKEGTEFVAWRRVLAAFVRHVARNDRWKGEKKGGRSVDADESGSNYREDGGSSVGIWERVDPVAKRRRDCRAERCSANDKRLLAFLRREEGNARTLLDPNDKLRSWERASARGKVRSRMELNVIAKRSF